MMNKQNDRDTLKPLIIRQEISRIPLSYTKEALSPSLALSTLLSISKLHTKCNLLAQRQYRKNPTFYYQLREPAGGNLEWNPGMQKECHSLDADYSDPACACHPFLQYLILQNQQYCFLVQNIKDKVIEVLRPQLYRQRTQRNSLKICCIVNITVSS